MIREIIEELFVIALVLSVGGLLMWSGLMYI